ncbi:hypothetical protein SAMN05660657_01835 [Geodermatophilus amargosae]|uniref:Uncharacterized protein n=1 Tax=Geodermatophilus amargosae TaxID=1296565 RepID=A0A1I6ZDV0_9ACTN|nr:hypothetical protein [Geodermatophilus amargosae]SFT60862.1 hypothetical protein SAMN05660657_01835 [Geodermatophilus amargosae]
MASLSKDAAAFFARYKGVETPDWLSASDLAPMGVDAQAAEQALGRVTRSHGVVRLTGPAVDANSARLDGAGDMMTKPQKLVTALGASMEGSKSQVGVVAERFRSATQLRLLAGTAPGSVMLFVVPEASPVEELYPGGKVPLIDDQTTLVDRSADALIDVLSEASSPAPDTAALSRDIDEYGARVAAGIKGLAGAVVDSGIELEWSWATPSRTRRTARLSTGTARWLGELVAGQSLDVESVQLVGTLRTISDHSAWELRTDAEETIRIKPGEIAEAVTSSLRIGQRVRVDALLEMHVSPGGIERPEYTAVEVLTLDDASGRQVLDPHSPPPVDAELVEAPLDDSD